MQNICRIPIKTERHRMATIKLTHHDCSRGPSQGMWTKKERSVNTEKEEKEVGNIVHMWCLFV